MTLGGLLVRPGTDLISLLILLLLLLLLFCFLLTSSRSQRLRGFKSNGN